MGEWSRGDDLKSFISWWCPSGFLRPRIFFEKITIMNNVTNDEAMNALYLLDRDKLKPERRDLLYKFYDGILPSNLDCIQILMDIGNEWTELVIEFFHDDYVNWVKSKNNEVKICSICIEPCLDDELYNKCGHLFHKKCINMWNMNNGCPNCRYGRK